jgi:hypothetical protein
MLPVRRPTRRECLAAACAGAALVAFGRADAAVCTGTLRITWERRVDGTDAARVSGVRERAWRCELFGPAFSRVEYWISEPRSGSCAQFEPGVLERGRYVVRILSGTRVACEADFERV